MERTAISVPESPSRGDRAQYVDDIFHRRLPFPWMNGGMGVDFSNDSLVTAVMKEGGVGTLAASAIGFNAERERIMAEKSGTRRMEIYHAANIAEIQRQVASVRERMPDGILAVNLMAAMKDFKAMVDAIGETGQVDLLCVGAGMPRDLGKQMTKYPRMKYAPIVSSRYAAELMWLAGDRDGARVPDAYYVELPQFAGGHLGARNVEEALDEQAFDPQKIHDEIRRGGPKGKFAPDTLPLILAGGIAYGPNIEEAYGMGYDGVSLGTRLLLTQESGLPNQLLTKYYLDSRYAVRTVMTSPAGLPSRIVDAPKNIEGYLAQARAECVLCIGERCKFKPLPPEDLEGRDDKVYCIANRLTRTRRGEEGGTLFTGARLTEMRSDPIYQREGGLYIPTVREAMEFVFTGKATDKPRPGLRQGGQASGELGKLAQRFAWSIAFRDSAGQDARR